MKSKMLTSCVLVSLALANSLSAAPPRLPAPRPPVVRPPVVRPPVVARPPAPPAAPQPPKPQRPKPVEKPKVTPTPVVITPVKSEKPTPKGDPKKLAMKDLLPTAMPSNSFDPTKGVEFGGKGNVGTNTTANGSVKSAVSEAGATATAQGGIESKNRRGTVTANVDGQVTGTVNPISETSSYAGSVSTSLGIVGKKGDRLNLSAGGHHRVDQTPEGTTKETNLYAAAEAQTAAKGSKLKSYFTGFAGSTTQTISLDGVSGSSQFNANFGYRDKNVELKAEGTRTTSGPGTDPTYKAQFLIELFFGK